MSLVRGHTLPPNPRGVFNGHFMLLHALTGSSLKTLMRVPSKKHTLKWWSEIRNETFLSTPEIDFADLKCTLRIGTPKMRKLGVWGAF